MLIEYSKNGQISGGREWWLIKIHSFVSCDQSATNLSYFRKSIINMEMNRLQVVEHCVWTVLLFSFCPPHAWWPSGCIQLGYRSINTHTVAACTSTASHYWSWQVVGLEEDWTEGRRLDLQGWTNNLLNFLSQIRLNRFLLPTSICFSFFYFGLLLVKPFIWLLMKMCEPLVPRQTSWYLFTNRFSDCTKHLLLLWFYFNMSYSGFALLYDKMSV